MTNNSGRFVQGRYVEGLPATARSSGGPPGPELTTGAAIDPSTPVTESTAETAGCAGQGTAGGEEQAATGSGEASSVEEQLGQASEAVTRAVDDVVVAVRTLVGSEEGHRYLEARATSAGETLLSIVRDLGSRLDASLKRK